MEIIDLRFNMPTSNADNSDFNPRTLTKFGLNKMVLLPDFNPGKSYLPVGTVALFDREIHTPFPLLLGRDIGCGMGLYKTDLLSHNIDMQQLVDELDHELTISSEIEFTLGNHFIDFCEDETGLLYFVLHAGYKQYGMMIVKNGFIGDKYLYEVKKNIKLAAQNRRRLAILVYRVLGLDAIPPLLDKPHNTVQLINEGFLYRKGAVELFPGELSLLPSNLSHPIFLIKGKRKIRQLENSFSHGTRRKVSIHELQNKQQNFNKLREKIKMPTKLSNSMLEKLLPTEYENFFSYAHLYEEYVSIEKKFEVLGYLGFKNT